MQNDRLSGAKTRQGRLGRPVFWVLIASLALVVLYLIGLVIWANTDLVTRYEPPDRAVVGQGSGSGAPGKPPATEQ